MACIAAITYDANRTDITAAKEVVPHLLIAAFYADISPENVTDGATHGGRMDVSKLPTWSRGDAVVYLCGPVAYMQAQ
jgi:nitric oxide dioxygenase